MVAMFLTMIPPMTFESSAATGIDPNSTDAQYIGYGFDVTSGALKKTNLQDIKPILNLNSDIFKYVNVKDVNENESGNVIAYSAQQLASEVSQAYEAGINGKIKMVSLDIASSFDTSKKIATAVAERYELYYYNVIRKTMVIQLDVSQLRDYLSDDFRSELLSVKNQEQATALLSKYGTHLITGYNLGGRMEATSYQTKSNLKTEWATDLSISEQISAATAAASAGESFSLTQHFAENFNKETQSCSYKYTALGGMAVEALTIDHLFTYNASLVDGKGNYIYGRWLYSINNGENLDIVGIAKGGQAVPIWELLPQSSEYNMIRRYLMSAYVEKCGDSYSEYCEKYKTLYVNIQEQNQEQTGNIDLNGYYSISNYLVSSVSFDDSDTSSTIVPETTIVMDYKDTTKIEETVEWLVSSGGEYAMVTDDKNGAFWVKDIAKGHSFTVCARVNDVVKAEWTFHVKDSTYSAGNGVITDTTYDPYILTTVEDLRQLSINSSDWSKDFVLADNIDLSGIDASTWSTIGTAQTPFSGTFDGNYCTISGYTKSVDDRNYLGLFGVIDGGTVKNLKLESPMIHINDGNTDVYAGSLAGKNSGTISNCIVNNPTVSVRYGYREADGIGENKGENKGVNIYCGTIAGTNNGTIQECGVVNPHVIAYSEIDTAKDPKVTIKVVAGGLVGYADGGNYNYCYVKTETAGNDSSRVETFVRGDTSKIFGITTSNTFAKAYSGGFAGLATSITMNECVIDIPNVIYAQTKNCDGEKSERCSGTVVGKVEGGTEKASLTKVFAHSVRQAAAPTYDGGIVATIENGSGDKCISEGSGSFKVISANLKMSDGNLNNSIGSKNGKWCGEGNQADGFPVLKSFAFSGLSIDTSSAKTFYYYNQEFSPVGLKVSVVPNYGQGEAISLKTYRLDFYAFDKNTINTIGYNIPVWLGSNSGSYKSSVNKCNIESIMAKDLSTEKLYVGDTYSTETREIQVSAILSNKTIIDLGEMNAMPYVNYPEGTYTVSTDPLVYGNNRVTVTYGGKKDEFLVECDEDELLSIELVSSPNKVKYITGDVFAPNGMVVKAYYESGVEKVVDNKDLELIGTTITDGENEVIVSYGPYITTKDPIRVTGTESIAILSMPTKTEYSIGEAIDFSGLKIRFTADGETFREVDGSECAFSATVITIEGENPLTLTYQNHSVTFVLIGKETRKQYKVTWLTETDSYSEFYFEGETPVFTGSVAKSPDKQFTYTFVSWDQAIVPVAADVTYTAQYQKTYVNYSVVFLDADRTIISKKDDYHYGDAIAVPENPTLQGYTFKGWSPSVGTVTGDMTFLATYNEMPTVTVHWVVDGNVIDEIYYKGETPTFKGQTAKSSDQTYIYTFRSWDKDLKAVDEDVTITALYDKTYVLYSIRFLDRNGNVISEKSDYHYGDTVIVPDAPLEEGYEFDNWNPAVTVVNGSRSYQAVYSVVNNPSDNTQTGESETDEKQPDNQGNALLRGDTNGNGIVEYADAVLLLRFIHFPSINAIKAGTGDVNGDGKITSDDAIYLKNYVFSPSAYPIR